MMDDAPDLPLVDQTSPLRAFLTEAHEVYTELISVGFPKDAAASIVAVLVSEAVNSRDEDGFDIEVVMEDDDEDDLDDDDDFGGTG